MDLINLNTLLFAGKWAFIGLVYLILVVIVFALRREIASRPSGQPRPGSPVPGRLKVLAAGSDPHVQPGTFLSLKAETILGAEPESDIHLTDQYVSGRHARLHWDGSGWWVTDLGSTNGTQVDNHPCPPQIPQPLPTGAQLSLGDMLFVMV
jgi:hypothetical protein